LDWSPGSYHAAFFIALYKGYYAEEGLDVAIDRGKGSAEVVRQLASGVYDIGHPDMNVLIEFNSRNPDAAMPMLMVNYEQYPSGIFALKKSGITGPKDLEGRMLGPSVNDSTFKLWPVFAERAGIDLSKVKITYLDPSLREALLIKGQVDAITGQIFRSILDLKARGIKEDQIVSLMYKDYGLDLYGNGLVASRTFVKKHPDAVRGFIRATIKGVRAMVKDRDLAVSMLVKYEPLLNAEIERERLDVALDCCILTENVKRNGYGSVDLDRLKRAITQISKIYELPRVPAVDEIFDGSYLPPREERQVN
jgi:NitT/TauT family transport system substrate-binding protein